MKIINIADRALTDAELTTINTFAELTSSACFACLGSQVLAILPLLAEEHIDELVKLVRERMAEIDGGSDYSRFYMPGGYVMVGMPGGICALSDGESEGEPSSVLMLRHMCIDACREGNIAAIVFNND